MQLKNDVESNASCISTVIISKALIGRKMSNRAITCRYGVEYHWVPFRVHSLNLVIIIEAKYLTMGMGSIRHWKLCMLEVLTLHNGA